MADSKSDFLRLRNVDSSFQNRSSSVFDRLDVLEPSNDNSRRGTANKNTTEREGKWNKERNNPARSAARRLPSRVPQHVLSPEKWTKYSLEDDGSGEFRGLNEHSLNKHAAHSFLAELKKRKSIESPSKSVGEQTKSGSKDQDLGTESKDGVKTIEFEGNKLSKAKPESATDQDSQDDSKLVFKKPEPKTDVTLSSLSSGIWKDGSYVMPEYVVGSARPKGSSRVGKRPGVKQVAGNGPVNLGHLEGEGENDLEEGKKANMKGKRNFRKRKLDSERKDDDCEEI